MAVVTDPVADLLTRIRNASRRGHSEVEIPRSQLKLEIVKILTREKFVHGFQSIDDDKQGVIRVYLKYGAGREPVVTQLKRVSTPGRRVYVPAKRVPRVLNGLGVAIVSTSRGLLVDREARKQGVGGELLCYVW